MTERQFSRKPAQIWQFPEKPCYICYGIIENLDGTVILNNYMDYLTNTVKNAGGAKFILQSPSASFINAITLAYLTQQREIIKASSDGTRIYAFDELTKESNLEAKDHKRRLESVLNAKPIPKKNVALLSHYSCLPKEFPAGEYDIDLRRIDTPEKALEWTFQSRAKRWFNAEGWIIMLEDLFGRNPEFTD